MANPEHLDMLKQRVEVWNEWREEHPEIEPDISHAALDSLDLRGANFSYTNFSHSDLKYSNLVEAYLVHANLSHTYLISVPLMSADLSYANLSHALFVEARLKHAELCYANLSEAQTNETDFSYVDFTGADLSKVSISGGNFRGANLSNVDFSNASVEYSIFAEVDLSTVKGLETIRHSGPSTIGIDTIIHSQGKIPEIFLRGAGVPQPIIEQIPALIGSLKPVDYYSCFISYSSKDDAFAHRLYADLQSNNVRCWFAPEDLKIGDKFWNRIDESIRLYDKLLVVLSEHSVQSDWVEREVMAALEKEKRGKTVLFPITLDDAVKACTAPWAADIRRSRHIGDFRRWKKHDDYQKAFERLLRDLKAAS